MILGRRKGTEATSRTRSLMRHANGSQNAAYRHSSQTGWACCHYGTSSQPPRKASSTILRKSFTRRLMSSAHKIDDGRLIRKLLSGGIKTSGETLFILESEA